jgi:hypothetical protein
MSKMGAFVLELQEVVEPMVYMGHGDEAIKREVKKHIPDVPDSWIENEISRARFDQNNFDVYF